MSREIDERVVQMRFDNGDFETNAKQSLSTIEKLKSALNFSGASKGLEAVSDAASKCNLNPLSSAVDAVRVRFSALEVMGVTALANIANSAVNTGKKIISAFTIDPVKTGFAEYETQINAIQTILANTQSKGTTIDQVNEALDELNRYADQTIYNFTEMTRNIGTFTAAGVELDKSVTSIKGIANLAAVSGSNAQQASTAMYQLSQALAAGTVKLQDWNSVVNAGMGGEVFQTALKRTAEHFGTNVDAMIEKYGSFRESLSRGGWLTSEVLTETLTQLSGAYTEADLIAQGYTEAQAKEITQLANTALSAATDVKTFTQLFDTLKEAAQSGWTQSWEIVVGDFEEAKELLSEINAVLGDTINASAEARNEMLQGWKDLGGRTELIQSIRNAFEGLMSILSPVKNAFHNVFPPTTAQQLYDLTVNLRELTENFKISDSTASKLQRTFEGFFSLFDIGIKGAKALAGGFLDILGYVSPLSGNLLDMTASLGDFIVGLDEAVDSTNLFEKAVNKVVSVIGSAISLIKTFVGNVVSLAKQIVSIDTSGIDSFADKIETRFEPLSGLVNLVKKAFQTIAGILKETLPLASRLASIIAEAFGDLGNAILAAFDTASFDPIIDMLNSGLFAAILLGVKNFIDSLSDITSSGSGMLDSLKGILDGVGSSLEAWQSNIKADTLLKIAGAIGVLAVSLIAMSTIDSNKMFSSLSGLTVLFTELFGSMFAMDKVLGSAGLAKINGLAVAMITMSTAITILASATKKLADLDWDELLVGLTGVAGLAAILVKSSTALSNASGHFIKGASGMILFGAAINVLAIAVEKLSGIDTAGLIQGLLGVGALCTELALFLNNTNLDNMGLLKGAGLLLLAQSVNVLSTAVSKFTEIDSGGVVKGLAAVGAILAEVAAFVNLTGNAKNVISTATGMTILGGAMLIFSQAVSQMGSLSWDEIGRGLTTMAGALAAVTLAVNLLPDGMISKSLGIVGMAAGLSMVGETVRSLSDLSWEEIAAGITALGGSMAILVVGLNALTGALPGAAAMLTVSAAMAIFTPALQALGSMSLTEIGTGLLALAGTFGVVGVAGLALSPLTPVIVALSAAITLLGVGCASVGAGVLAFSAGLSALAVSGVAGAAALVTVVTSLISLIPMVLTELGNGVIAFAGVITNGAPAILEAVEAVAQALIQVMVNVTPDLVAAVMNLLMTLLNTIVEYMPQIVDAGMKIILGFLQGISNNIQAVVETAAQIVINFIEGISNKLPDLIQAAFDLVIAFIDGLADAIEKNTPRLVESIIGLGEAVIKGLVDALLGGIGSVIDAVKNIGSSIINGLKDILDIHSPSGESEEVGEQVIAGLVNALDDGQDAVAAESTDLGKTVSEELQNGIDTKGVEKALSEVVKAIDSTVDEANASIQEINGTFVIGSDVTEEFWSKYQTMAEGMEEEDEVLQTTSESVDNLSSSLENAGTVAEESSSKVSVATAAIGDTMNVMDFASDVVTEFERRYSSAFVALGNTAPMEASRVAVANLANVTYESSKAAEEAAKVAEEANSKAQDASKSTAETTEQAITKIEELTQSFKELRESMLDNISSQLDIFSEFSTDSDLTSDQLLANMESQIAGFTTWADNIQLLAERGINQGLLQTLAEMGPQGYEYVSAFVSMTEEQLSRAGDLYAQSLIIPETVTTQILSSYAYAGLMASQGFTNAIDPNAASANVTELGNNALNALQTVLQEHSPSRATYAMGENFIAGFVNGVNASTSSGAVAAQITTFGSSVLAAFQAAMSQDKFNALAATICLYFVNGFNNNSSIIQNGLDMLLSRVVTTSTTNVQSSFTTAGSTLITYLNTGINNQKPVAEATLRVVLFSLLGEISSKYTNFQSNAQTVMTFFINGITSKKNESSQAVKSVLDKLLDDIRGRYSEFETAGRYLVEGFAAGITANTYLAEARARAMAAAAAEAAANELDEHSPSRVGYQIGDYFGLGFVNAISGYASKAYESSATMADMASKGLNDSIHKIKNFVLNGFDDLKPTITPVLDLSEVSQRMQDLDAVVSRNAAMAISADMARVRPGFFGGSPYDDYDDGGSKSKGNTYNFTQNNYSPKALSRGEIYRQTKNQFSAMERMVES